MPLIQGTKGIKVAGPKVSPTTPDEAQFAKIMRFVRSAANPASGEEYTPDSFYIGQFRMAHNAIDRDGERFSEKLLERFAETAVRKTMLMDHDTWESRASAVGKFFDAEIEKVPVSQFTIEREDDHFLWLSDPEGFYRLKVPCGQEEVWWLAPWFYVPKGSVDPATIVKIDTGIYDWASIGFTAQQRVPVTGPGDEVQYREYLDGPDAEMREGSLVYLGAQQGAAVKSAKGRMPSHERTPDNHKEEPVYMDFLKRLSQKMGRVFTTEDEAVEALAEMKASLDAAQQSVKTATERAESAEAKLAEAQDAAERVKTLAPLFEDEKLSAAQVLGLAREGQKYRDDLVARYVNAKVVLGHCQETPEAKTALTDVARGLDIGFLKSETGQAEALVREKYPDRRQTGGETRDEKNAGAEAEAKAGDGNPFVPKEKEA